MQDASPAEQPARSSGPLEDYHRLACAHAGVALVATDADLIIRIWSSDATQILGASAGLMIGTSILSLVPIQRRRAVEKMLRRMLRERKAKRFHFAQRDANGERRHLAVSVAPIGGCDGAARGVSTCITDVTRLTERLHEAEQGRKMTALGEMAGALAHHFNNILGGLVTGVDFALGVGDPDITQRTLEQTARSLAKASRLMEHLLAFAEGDHRQDDLSDLTEVILQGVDLVEPELSRAKIKLELNINVLPVTAIPRQQLLTVIFNLTHNAVDAMPDGGTLRIDVEHVADQCVLRFTDVGCGVEEEELDRIFEPFYSTKTVPPGAEERAAGFGLAVVHGILQEVGGKISVTSAVGRGTTVEVSIPCRGPDGDRPPRAIPPSAPPAARKKRRHRGGSGGYKAV